MLENKAFSESQKRRLLHKINAQTQHVGFVMPKLKNQPPKLSRIKSSNAAVVYFNRSAIYMGPWGSECALQNYSKFLVEWSKSGTNECAGKKEATTATLSAAFLKHTKDSGADSGMLLGRRTALKILRKRFPHLPVSDFGPIALREVQAALSSDFFRKFQKLFLALFVDPSFVVKFLDLLDVF